MVTCTLCDGDGGWEVAVAGRNPPWGDGADDGYWVECLECSGCGLVAGIPPSIDIDDLPPPRGMGETNG